MVLCIFVILATCSCALAAGFLQGYAEGRQLREKREFRQELLKLEKDRLKLEEEALSRFSRLQTESGTTVENFYQVHSDLKGHEALVASVAPWVKVENPGLAPPELLNAIASRSRGLITRESENLSGDWHGLIVQQTILPDGSNTLNWAFLKINLTQSGNSVVGVGSLIDGQKLALRFRVDNDQLSGSVMNTTANLGFGLKGTITPTKMLVDYQSQSSKSLSIIGQAVLVR